MLVLAGLAIAGAVVAGLFAWQTLRDSRRAETAFAQKLEVETGRLRIGIALGSVRTQCDMGRCAEAAQYFHPTVRERLSSETNTISERVLTVLMTPTLSQAALLANTPDQKLAQQAHLNPNECVVLSSGHAKVIGCAQSNNKERFQILHMQGLESLTP